MQPEIIAGKKARLALNLLGLGCISCLDDDPSADGTAIGVRTNEFHLQPAVPGQNVIPKQGRWLIQIDNQDVEIAIVVEITEGAASADVRLRDGRSGFV